VTIMPDPADYSVPHNAGGLPVEEPALIDPSEPADDDSTADDPTADDDASVAYKARWDAYAQAHPGSSPDEISNALAADSGPPQDPMPPAA
jgi:hypothetical protein